MVLPRIEQLSGLSATADALADGDISLEHAAAITEQASKTDDPQGAQRSLLAEARTSDPGRVRKAGRRLRREQDRRAAEARKVARAHQQRTLSLRADEAAKTMWIEGRLPLIAGMKVRAAIDALAAPDGADDPRSYSQRMADGLVELVDRARSGDGAGLPSQGGLDRQATITVTSPDGTTIITETAEEARTRHPTNRPHHLDTGTCRRRHLPKRREEGSRSDPTHAGRGPRCRAEPWRAGGSDRDPKTAPPNRRAWTSAARPTAPTTPASTPAATRPHRGTGRREREGGGTRDAGDSHRAESRWRTERR